MSIGSSACIKLWKNESQHNVMIWHTIADPGILYPSQAWCPERETAAFISGQAPQESGQGTVKPARVPAYYCYETELERFRLVMSLGQGVSSMSVSQQFT